MHRTIRIGFLANYSSIYPTLSQDLMEGIWSGIPEKLHRYFELVPEYVRFGEPKALEPVLEKMLAFQNVDMITGMANYRSMANFTETINKFKKICLFADLGEYVPFMHDQSPYMFYNSYQSWQSQYAMGYWAQRKFGGKGRGIMVLAGYESGYHFHGSFHHGVQVAEPTPMKMLVMRRYSDLDVSAEDMLMEYLEGMRKEAPTFASAMFSGDEAVDFLRVYHREGLHKEVPLVITAPMATYEVLNQVSNLDMTLYAGSIWDMDAEDKLNKQFKQAFVNRTGRMPNMFALLGFEIGQALEQMFPYFQRREFDKVQRWLSEQTIETPRGMQSFHLKSQYATPVINIEKITIANNLVRKMVIEQGKSLPYDHKVFDEIQNGAPSGYYNTYLCV